MINILNAFHNNDLSLLGKTVEYTVKMQHSGNLFYKMGKITENDDGLLRISENVMSTNPIWGKQVVAITEVK